MPDRQPVPRATPDLIEEQIERLREIFPEAFSEGSVDFDRLRETLGEIVDDSPERYSLTWAGKREALRQLQRPSWGTLVPDREQSVNFDDTDNVFIEGENLEVLKLLRKSYSGRVKMIYIDPPYNTGNDFVYPDDFAEPKDAYLRITGQRDDEGNLLTTNPETSGRYHSAWLCMMYPRLFLARQLLREDGVIFISIDDHEVHNLRLLMNEVFGEECFKNCIIFRRGAKSVQAQFETVDALGVGHEYVLLYAKQAATRFAKLDIDRGKSKPGTWNNHWRGTDRPTMRYELFAITPEEGQWRWGRERSLKAIENYERLLEDSGCAPEEVAQEVIDAWYDKQIDTLGEDIDLLRLSDEGKAEHYVAPSDTKLGSDLWTDLSTRGSAEIKRLFGSILFDNPKPTSLIDRMLRFITPDPEEPAVILDFFAGSCTAAHAVLDLNREDGGNRRFVMVQLPEPTPDASAAREAGFETIADIGRERIRRVIGRLEEDDEGRLDVDDRNGEDLGFRVFKLAETNLRPWREVDLTQEGAEAAVVEQLQRQMDPLREGWSEEAVIAEVALKEGFGLNCRVEPVEDLTSNTVYRVTDPDLAQAFYICLDDEIEEATWLTLDLTDEELFVCRDVALDDTKLANLALQCHLHTI